MSFPDILTHRRYGSLLLGENAAEMLNAQWTDATGNCIEPLSGGALGSQLSLPDHTTISFSLRMGSNLKPQLLGWGAPPPPPPTHKKQKQKKKNKKKKKKNNSLK